MLKVTDHGYTDETFAIAAVLTGESGPVDGAGLAHRAELRQRIRAYLDAAEQPTRYSGQRFDAAQGLASLLADILRERR